MSDSEFRDAFESTKSGSVSQLLMKAGRLTNERGLSRVTQRAGLPRLRPSHMAVLPHIEFAGTRMSTLAERLGVTKQAVSQTIEDLEILGIIKRIADPVDGRAKLVVFSEEAPKFLMQGMEVLATVDADLKTRLGSERYESLLAVLLEVIDELEG